MEEESINDPNDHIQLPLPILTSIWDCPMMNKVLIPGSAGNMVCGWTCGWCPVGRSPFKGDSAPRALAHVAKVPGESIRFGSLFSHKAERGQQKQLKLCANANVIDLHAPEKLNIAIADFNIFRWRIFP